MLIRCARSTTSSHVSEAEALGLSTSLISNVKPRSCESLSKRSTSKPVKLFNSFPSARRTPAVWPIRAKGGQTTSPKRRCLPRKKPLALPFRLMPLHTEPAVKLAAGVKSVVAHAAWTTHRASSTRRGARITVPVTYPRNCTGTYNRPGLNAPIK